LVRRITQPICIGGHGETELRRICLGRSPCGPDYDMDAISADVWADLPPSLRPEVGESFAEVWQTIASPGACWTGAQRVALAAVARAAAPRPPWDQPPSLEDLSRDVPAGAELSPWVEAIADRLACASSTVDRDVVSPIVDELGAAAYAELAAVVAMVVPVDHFHRVLGLEPGALPTPVAGDPHRNVPDAMVDIGGHIPMAADSPFNVARSLSLAGEDNNVRLREVRAMYSGAGMADMVWNNRALSRPQVELLAARTSALNECFY